MIAYLDTSAAAKLVWREPESEALRGFLAERDAGTVRSSMLLETELRRAAARNRVPQERVTTVLDRLELADLGREMLTYAGLMPGDRL